MHSGTKWILIGSLALCCRPADSKMLVTTEALAASLDDPSLVLLHVGSQKDFNEGHIPGARLITLGDISVTGERGLRLELPPVDTLNEYLGRLGISDTSRIVLYHGTPSVQSATRVWFTLDYLGLGDRAALLDGGLALWKAEGRRLSTDSPVPAKPARFISRPRPDLVVAADWIQARSDDPGLNLVDARTPEFYSGASAGSMPRPGRIPGARSVPYPTLFTESGTFRSAGELRKLLGTKEGPVVTYCHIGQQATVPYFVARLLGMDAKLYDGSFQDWSSRDDLPVVRD
jgi:thiosulfate/3-mercaptopyruvate sulfurtransferase